MNSIWRNRKKLKQSLESAGFSTDCKRLRTSNHSDVDAALLVWFKQARSTNIPVSGPLLLEKATVLARALGNKSFTATAGFIDRWKKRHCIVMKKVSGEAGSVVDENTRPWLNLSCCHSTSQKMCIMQTKQGCSTIKLKPDKSLCFKNEKCTGGKKSKERLTALVVASMAGEKLPLFVIGKSKTPRCFKGVKTLPLEYTANAKAWMTGDIFSNWLNKWNRNLSSNNRHILLVIDNYSAPASS